MWWKLSLSALRPNRQHIQRAPRLRAWQGSENDELLRPRVGRGLNLDEAHAR